MQGANGLLRAKKAVIQCVMLLAGAAMACVGATVSYTHLMIDRGFTYYVPPFMIRGNVVNGVMSFSEMENMMYKICLLYTSRCV